MRADSSHTSSRRFTPAWFTVTPPTVPEHDRRGAQHEQQQCNEGRYREARREYQDRERSEQAGAQIHPQQTAAAKRLAAASAQLKDIARRLGAAAGGVQRSLGRPDGAHCLMRRNTERGSMRTASISQRSDRGAQTVCAPRSRPSTTATATAGAVLDSGAGASPRVMRV